MILCKNGHANPDGATYCAVCKVYIDSSVQAPGPTTPQPAPAVVALAPSSLSVGAGGEVSCELRLENAGAAPDDYVLELTGQAAGFGSLDPAGLSLAPGAAGTSRVTFRPDGGAPGGGELPFAVVVHSRQLPDRPVSAQGVLTIAGPPPKAALSAELTPQASKGRTAGAHVLTVHNPGSTPVTVGLTAVAPDGAVAVDLQPPTLTIGAGESARAQVRVTPRETFLLGRRRTHPFRVTVAPNLALDGSMVQRARIPLLLPLAVIAALVALVAYLATRGGGDHTYRGEVLQDNPIAYWRLDESPGTTSAADSSGHGETGSYVDNVTLGQTGALTSQPDSAAAFDGASGWLNIPDLVLGGDFTLEAWVQLSGEITNADSIVGQEGAGQDVNFFAARLRIFQTPAECDPGQPVIPGEQCWDVLVSNVHAVANQWTYWVITRSGSDLRLYKDGDQISAGAVPWTKPFLPKAVARGNGGFLRGFLDEVAIYDHALDPSRIRAHFDAR